MRLIAALIAVVASAATAAPQLARKSVLNGKVSLLVPTGFKPMDKEMLAFKYPSERRPPLVFTNEKGSVNVAINHTAGRVPPGQLRELHRQLEAGLRQQQPSAEWIRSEVTQINGRGFVVVETRTQAADTKVRNMMLATPYESRLLLISFNTTQDLESEWAPVGRRIINSVKLKK
jgi:hypothetical protein